MKRAMIWGLLLALIFTLCGCSGSVDLEPGSSQLGAYSDRGGQVETIPARDAISMIFYEDMDTHPLTATNRENHELLKLVYSPLLRLDGTLKPEYVLAESVKIEGTDVLITLKKGLKFSDGSAVTAKDLDRSIQTVRENPTSPYYARLANIKRYDAESERTLSITLKEADVDFINCLDIPIVKKEGTLGCGPYKFSTLDGKRVLVPNKHYFAQPTIQTIHLKAPKDEQERQDMFAVGLLDVYFGLAEGEQVFAGGKGYNVQAYPGDNLLYLGVNCREGLLKSGAFRRFFSRITARDKLVQSVLLDQAEAAIYPYQPSWYKAEQSTQSVGYSDAEKRKAAEALGLQVTEKALLDPQGEQLSFGLLVVEESAMHQSAAQAVAEGLAIAGVKIEIEAVPREKYDARLAAGEFDFYLGEVKTGRTLNPALYAAESSINFSGYAFETLQKAAEQYKSGEMLLSDFCKVFDRYTPIIPLAYRGGALFATADIGEFKSTGSWALYGDFTKLITKETEKTK